MRQPSRRITVYLGDISFPIYKKLIRWKEYGWFSKFVSEQMIEHYGKNFEEKVLTELLNDKQRQRDKLEKEMDMIQKKLTKVKRK